MFETAYPNYRDPIDELIDRRAAEARAELKRLAEKASDEIDIRLGFPASFVRRSRGQRRRYERQRQLEERS